MRTSNSNQHQPLFAWDILVPYAVLVVALLGLASRVKTSFLAVASAFVMIYVLGMLLVKWLVEVGGAELGDDERIPLAIVSGVALIALVGAASFVVWPARALFLARILLGLAGTLLCATILVKRARAPRLSTHARVTKTSVPVKPYGLVAALGLVLLIGLVLFLSISREGAEHYTELFLARNEIKSCSNAQASEDEVCIDIQIGVVNMENEPIEYRLALTTPLNTGYLDPFTLRGSETYKVSVEFPARICEQGGGVDVALYAKESSSPYRSIRLSCALLSPSGEIDD